MITARSLAPIIRQHAFFAELNDSTIELIAGCAQNVRMGAGTTIARQGEPADTFYLIREGRVAIGLPAPGGNTLTIQTLDEHDVVGWAWLMPPYEWHFDVTVVRALAAIAMDGKCLRAKCETDPALGYELMKRFSHTMVERLKATQLQLLDVYGINNAAPAAPPVT